MNKGFAVLEFTLLTLLVGALVSGFLTVRVEKIEKKVDVAIHKEVLKTGLPIFTTNK